MTANMLDDIEPRLFIETAKHLYQMHDRLELGVMNKLFKLANSAEHSAIASRESTIRLSICQSMLQNAQIEILQLKNTLAVLQAKKVKAKKPRAKRVKRAKK